MRGTGREWVASNYRKHGARELGSSHGNRRILIVDDDSSLAGTLEIILQRVGHNVTVVHSGEDALAFIGLHQPSLVITDVIMPGMDGIALIKKLRMSHPDCPALLFSGSSDTREMLEAAQEEGHAFELLTKPVPPLQMLARVASLLEQSTSVAI